MGAEDLGDAFSQVADQIIADLIRIAIKRSVVEPLADALFPEGGGGILSFLGSIFGRDTGGPVRAGQMYRVNESAGSGRTEYFRPSQSGTVIPLGQVNQSLSAPAAASGGIATVRVILSDDLNGRIASISGDVAVQVVAQAAPAIASMGANEAVRSIGRPRL